MKRVEDMNIFELRQAKVAIDAAIGALEADAEKNGGRLRVAIEEDEGELVVAVAVPLPKAGEEA